MNSFRTYVDVACILCDHRAGEMFFDKKEAKEWTKKKGWVWNRNNQAFCP